jgi:hypothetical protein
MNMKTEKLYVWCGPLAMAVLMLGLLIARLIPPPSPGDDAARIADFYRAHAFDVRLGLIVAMFGAALLGPWIAVCAKQIGRIDGRDSASGFSLHGRNPPRSYLRQARCLEPRPLLRPPRTPAADGEGASRPAAVYVAASVRVRTVCAMRLGSRWVANRHHNVERCRRISCVR